MTVAIGRKGWRPQRGATSAQRGSMLPPPSPQARPTGLDAIVSAIFYDAHFLFLSEAHFYVFFDAHVLFFDGDPFFLMITPSPPKKKKKKSLDPLRNFGHRHMRLALQR